MFKLFKKKKEGEVGEEGTEAPKEEAPAESAAPAEETPKTTSTSSSSSPADLIKLSTEVDRLKTGQEAFQEVRKTFTDNFTRLSEQIGELRSMIFDRDRTIQTLELKAVKAADLVESTKPEKLMIEIAKQNVKIDALKANVEGNEAIMDRLMEELKEIRRKIQFFRGVEEIIKLSEEIKKELIEIKKIEGTISIETDKVQTIYSEMRRKMQDLDNFNTTLQESKVSVMQNEKDIDYLKTKASGLVEKEEFDKLVEKINGYSESLKEITKKSTFSRDLEKLKDVLDTLK